VNVTSVPDPTSAADDAVAVTATCSAFVSVNVTLHVPFESVVHDAVVVEPNLPDPFTPKFTCWPGDTTPFAFFTVAVTVTVVPTVTDVAENPSVDVFALGVPTNDRATGDEPAVPLPDCGVYTTADPANVTAAENVPTLAAVYFTEPTPLAFVFVGVATNPVPDEATATPDRGLPYLSNAYTVTSSTPPPASWLFVFTSTRVR
jgi:hypothetical protein